MSIKDGGPAFPVSQPPVCKTVDEFNRCVVGMSLRDYLIAHLPLEEEAGDWAQNVKAELLGRKPPDIGVEGWTSALQFEADFRAKWKAMQADAILRERGEA